LHTLFSAQTLPESDDRIRERTIKASQWFKDKFSEVFKEFIQTLSLETDNKELGKRMAYALNSLRQEISVKLAGIMSCEKGFSVSRYLRSLSKAEIDFTPKKAKKTEAPALTESDIQHGELFSRLKDWRDKKAEAQHLVRYQVLHQQVLIQIAVNLPENMADLKKIKGVGEKILEKYGEELLAMVADHVQTRGGKDGQCPYHTAD
jgi:superfamily II DNA helicase RecQ